MNAEGALLTWTNCSRPLCPGQVLALQDEVAEEKRKNVDMATTTDRAKVSKNRRGGGGEAF